MNKRRMSTQFETADIDLRRELKIRSYFFMEIGTQFNLLFSGKYSTFLPTA